MPRAVPLPLREQVVQMHQGGQSLIAIAQSLNLGYRTVRELCSRFREHGLEALRIQYDRCGPHGLRFSQALYDAALALKREHPRWGGQLILLQLTQQFPDEPRPHPRSLQRWFHQAGLQPPRATKPEVERSKAKEPHDVWQVDAKERMRLADGSSACTLTATDEASGGIVGVAVFPPVSLDTGSRGGRRGGDAFLV